MSGKTFADVLREQAQPPQSPEVAAIKRQMFDVVAEMRAIESQEKPANSADLQELVREWAHWNGEPSRLAVELVRASS